MDFSLICWLYFEVENFCGFSRSEHGHENLLLRNFKFIAAAVHGWRLDHKIFICEKSVYEQQNHEIFTLYPSNLLASTLS